MEQLRPVPVPFFDGARLDLLDEACLSAQGTPAPENFLAVGAADRLAVSHHGFAHSRDPRAECAEDGFAVGGMPGITTPARVWAHVHPKRIFVQHDHRSPAPAPHVAIEADCDRSHRHGLMPGFRWGQKPTKCGPFNAQVTLVNARNDASLAGPALPGQPCRNRLLRTQS